MYNTGSQNLQGADSGGTAGRRGQPGSKAFLPRAGHVSSVLPGHGDYMRSAWGPSPKRDDSLRSNQGGFPTTRGTLTLADGLGRTARVRGQPAFPGTRAGGLGLIDPVDDYLAFGAN